MSGGGGFGKGILANILGVAILLVMFVLLGSHNIFRDDLTRGSGFFEAIAVLAAVGFAIGIGGAVVMRGIAWLEGRVKHRKQRRSQAVRDRLANEIVDCALRGDELQTASVGPFVLYLRPFFLTGNLTLYGVTDALTHWSPGENLDLETLIAKSIQSVGTVVALGEPGENLGFGRVKLSESDWMDVFGQIASRAKLIVVIPSDRPGTVWEIQWLKRHSRLAACVFLMPPVVKELDTSEEWASAKAALAPLGLEIPSYGPDGLLFRVDSEGRLLDSWPPLHKDRIDLRKLIQTEEVSLS